jgi:hypothetical protein
MEFEDYCNICGIALLQKEVAGEISGTYINYDEHRNGILQMSFCPGCQRKIIDIIDAGMDRAVDRRLELLGNDSVDKHKIVREERKKVRSARDKDEDGSGGVKSVSPP